MAGRGRTSGHFRKPDDIITIYGVFKEEDDSLFYIGQTAATPQARLAGHAASNTSPCFPVIRDAKKRGHAVSAHGLVQVDVDHAFYAEYSLIEEASRRGHKLVNRTSDRPKYPHPTLYRWDDAAKGSLRAYVGAMESLAHIEAIGNSDSALTKYAYTPSSFYIDNATETVKKLRAMQQAFHDWATTGIASLEEARRQADGRPLIEEVRCDHCTVVRQARGRFPGLIEDVYVRGFDDVYDFEDAI